MHEIQLKYRTLTTAVGVLLAAGTASYAIPAAAQDSADRDDQPARVDDTPAVQFDPRIAENLQQLQAKHRIERDQLLSDPKAWAEGRALRALRHRAEFGQIWGNLVDSPDAQAALRIHADRMARLNRLLDLAQASPDAALARRVKKDIQNELVRHAQNMQILRASLGLR